MIEDAQSLVQVFAEKAKKLLLEDKVAAVLGCYTSASRQSVLPVFEQNNGVLLYPTLYEAQECSKNCFYTGAVPNQQLDDFVPYIINTLGRKKFYMVGSNYIYPKETNREVKALLEKNGGQNVGEEYAPLGHTEFSTIINNIAGSGADVIFSDLVGDSIVAFYKQFRQFGLTRRRSPDLHADHDRARDCGDGRGERGRSLHFVQLLPIGGYAREQVVRRALQGEIRRQFRDKRGDGSGLLLRLFPRPGPRKGEVDRSRRVNFRGSARPGIHRARRPREDRREEPPHLAVAAHRQGQRRRASSTSSGNGRSASARIHGSICSIRTRIATSQIQRCSSA